MLEETTTLMLLKMTRSVELANVVTVDDTYSKVYEYILEIHLN